MSTFGQAPTASGDRSQKNVIVRDGKLTYVTPQEADDYLHKGFLNRVGQIAPYGIMGLMGYGALTGGTGSLAALGSGVAAGPTITVNGTTVPFETGSGMSQFGLGSLGDFFKSQGGASAINAGGNIVGGLIQAGAQGKASNVQAQYAQQALDFAKQQYADAIKNFAPYMQASQGATAQLSDFLSHNRPPQLGSPTPTSSTPGVALGPTGGTAQMVTLRAPDGSQRQVPASQSQHYISLGAQPVQG